jgi:hypothetical protein
LSGSARGSLPVKGDIIEALWTEDGKVGEWLTVEVLLGDVQQLQAKAEKRERYMMCHRIQYFDADKSREWALLYWPDRPTRARKAGKAGESESAKRKKKQFDALEVVQWRYPRAL